jgi:uncharacterized protein YndB with AHSA1/START domain
MILKIAAAVSTLIAAILILAAVRPKTLRIQRSLSISAPPEKIFTLIDDFHNWPGWAPQDKEDVTMKRAYSGAASGIGAVSDWNSAGDAGKGRMSITESVPFTALSITVDFEKPFEAHNVNRFVLEPQGSSTRVTWTMQGTNLYVMRVMGVFVSIDRMMGKHFEAGLDNLKTIAEK